MADDLARDPTAVMARRLVAYGVDVVLTLAVAAIAFAARARSTEVPAFLDDACDLAQLDDRVSNCVQFGNTIYTLEGGDLAIIVLSGLAVSVLNLVLLQGATGGTIGKHATALRVVDADGNECGFGRALVRWLLLFVDVLFCGIVGLVTAFGTKGHQRVGDLVAKTYVVSARDLGRKMTGMAIGQIVAEPETGG